MKTRIIAFLSLLCLTSDIYCGSLSTKHSYKVKDIVIESAQFGTSLYIADVTSQVAKLLCSNEEGFTARNDTLKADPRPYANKCLVIDYKYKGKPYRFFITNQQYVSYNLLLENTKK